MIRMIAKQRTARPRSCLAVGACVSLAACASGQSILVAGNDATTTTRPAAPATTASSGTAGPPSTICLVKPCATSTPSAGGLPTTIQLVAPASEAGGPTGLGMAPGVTMSLAGNADFATCPVDALESASEPVHITFWHAMQSAQGDALAELTDQYNASQDRVVVELQNQNGYEELIDKYFQSSQRIAPTSCRCPSTCSSRWPTPTR